LGLGGLRDKDAELAVDAEKKHLVADVTYVLYYYQAQVLNICHWMFLVLVRYPKSSF